jgi:hypothetical protein
VKQIRPSEFEKMRYTSCSLHLTIEAKLFHLSAEDADSKTIALRLAQLKEAVPDKKIFAAPGEAALR